MTTPTIPLTSLHRVHMEPACTAGACQQGKAPCPCPQACQVSEGKPLTTAEEARFLALLAGYCAVAIAAVLFFSR